MSIPASYNPAQLKVCLYCGRSNPLSATLCEGCGASRFELAPLPTMPLQSQPQVQPQTPVQAQSQAAVQQIHPAIMILYFLFFGIFLAFFWLLLALSVAVSVIGLPLASSMLSITPTVAALYKTRTNAGDALNYGWRRSVERYRSAPIAGKIAAPLSFALCIALLLFWIYGRR